MRSRRDVAAHSRWCCPVDRQVDRRCPSPGSNSPNRSNRLPECRSLWLAVANSRRPSPGSNSPIRSNRLPECRSLWLAVANSRRPSPGSNSPIRSNRLPECRSLWLAVANSRRPLGLNSPIQLNPWCPTDQTCSASRLHSGIRRRRRRTCWDCWPHCRSDPRRSRSRPRPQCQDTETPERGEPDSCSRPKMRRTAHSRRRHCRWNCRKALNYRTQACRHRKAWPPGWNTDSRCRKARPAWYWPGHSRWQRACLATTP